MSLNLRFLCDQDVDAAVARMLRKLGYTAWTASSAGMSDASDDDLTVYAQERDAVLITHDAEFSERRRKNVVGRHVYLKCNEWDAADILKSDLEGILPILAKRRDVWVRLSPDADIKLSFKWE